MGLKPKTRIEVFKYNNWAVNQCPNDNAGGTWGIFDINDTYYYTHINQCIEQIARKELYNETQNTAFLDGILKGREHIRLFREKVNTIVSQVALSSSTDRLSEVGYSKDFKYYNIQP